MSLMQRSWQRHHRVIEVLFAYLQALLEDVLTLRASWGGMCIRNHLEHLITDVQHWSRHLEPVTEITLADEVAGL